MEPFTAGAIAALAFSKVFETTLERYTNSALDKIDELRVKIWERLQGHDKAEKALMAIEGGSKTELERLTVYLRDAMEDDETFAKALQDLAEEIEAGKTEQNQPMTQINKDQGHGIQQFNKVEDGGINQTAETITNNFS